MSEFQLHPQLTADCFLMGNLPSGKLLLHKNALVPWFILVPNTECKEFYLLDAEQQRLVQKSINDTATFITQHFHPDKLNIATIGNKVAQLHIHIIGRFRDDSFWPDPVWGQPEFKPYTDEEISALKKAVKRYFGKDLQQSDTQI